LPSNAGSSKYRKTVHRKQSIDKKKLPSPADISDKYVIHFILDGLNAQAFQKILSSNSLPTIKATFNDNGIIANTAVTVFPSTSTTAYQSVATGLFPGRSGIPHLLRVNREKSTVIDYLSLSDYNHINTDLINYRSLIHSKNPQITPPITLFDRLHGHPTASIYSSFQKGATIKIPTLPISAMWATFVTGNLKKIDRLAFDDVMHLFNQPLAQIPRYSLVGLYSIDVSGHKHGAHSQQVIDCLIQFDHFLSKFQELLAQKKIRDKTYIIVSADHGMHQTGKQISLKKILRHANILVKEKNPRKKKYTVIADNRGVASGQLYLNPKLFINTLSVAEVLKNITDRFGDKVDLASTLFNSNAIEFLIMRIANNHIRIMDMTHRSADIVCTEILHHDYCSYSFNRAKGDPLNYSTITSMTSLLDNQPHSSETWLAKSKNTDYPDTIIALNQLMSDGQAGDIIVTTKAPYSLNKEKNGNHGGLTKQDMHIPLMISGPDIRKQTIPHMRSVDLYPMIMDWFQLPYDPASTDGINRLQAPTPHNKQHQQLAFLDILMKQSPTLNKQISIPQFVNEFILPTIPATDFSKLRKALTLQMDNVHSQLGALSAYIDTIKDSSTIEHLKITQRAYNHLSDQLHRLDDIDHILLHCQKINSVMCRTL